MIVKTIVIKLDAPWVHSLKEKRRVVRSITSKIRNKFNVSIGEVDQQDTHQTIMLGLAYVTTSRAQSDRIFEKLIDFIEDNTDGQIIDIKEEFIYIK